MFRPSTRGLPPHFCPLWSSTSSRSPGALQFSLRWHWVCLRLVDLFQKASCVGRGIPSSPLHSPRTSVETCPIRSPVSLLPQRLQNFHGCPPGFSKSSS